ncbi:TPA: beta-ketoacyl-[acyl-carrier-protein] synthase II, partial [Neisseria gonorrhoeae]
ALQHAGLAPEDIGRINLHGTGTHHNDSMESRAVAAVFGNNTPCTSAKPQTGHTLGAAGAIEAAFAWGIADRQSNPEGKLPPRLWDGQNDPDLPAINLTGDGWETEKRIAASSSFAFGGSNCVLIIG